MELWPFSKTVKRQDVLGLSLMQKGDIGISNGVSYNREYQSSMKGLEQPTKCVLLHWFRLFIPKY